MTRSTRPTPGRHRRRALALAATTTLAGSLVGAVALGATHADAAPSASTAAGPSARGAAFGAAAREFGVPQSVLEAVSFSQTRWEAHAGQHSTDGGYGPMNLVDGTLYADDAAEGKDGTDGSTTGAAPTSVDTLGKAAALLGLPRQALRTSDAANIRGGAALLAAEQRALGLPTGVASEPGAWYAAVAHAGNATTADDAKEFADDTFAQLQAGSARTTTDGQAMSMASTRVTPQTTQLSKLGLKPAAKRDPNLECPAGLPCEWDPAPYEQYGPGAGDYGNHDLARRDVGSPKITTIVIHDTEASWDTTLGLIADPTYVSWHYSIRSEDGYIAQHVPTKDVAWHAGNWYVNMHSIGIEHEGFAPQGATWFTEPMYRKSAKLVAYLTQKYGIPVDRAHIIGHDQVPGTTPATVAGMHWDPGPYWDWSHYFDLIGKPLSDVGPKPSSQLVRILPGFNRNQQPVTGCDTSGSGNPCTPQGTNFVSLRQSPSDDAPLVKDLGLHPDGSASTTDVADMGARAAAGTDYAVAGRQGDWTAIWYLGDIAWFKNPVKHPSAVPVTGSYVVPKAGNASVPVYGRAYPETTAYPAGITPQTVTPLQYTIKAGQRYTLLDAHIPTDYYSAKTFAGTPPTDHVDVMGQDVYYEIDLGHRIAYVRAADVDIVKAK